MIGKVGGLDAGGGLLLRLHLWQLKRVKLGRKRDAWDYRKETDWLGEKGSRKTITDQSSDIIINTEDLTA